MTQESLTLGLAVLALGLAFLAAVLPWRKFAERWVANDPAKAMVYVRDGEELRPVPGSLSYLTEQGAFYAYRWAGRRAEVLVSTSYPYRYVRGRRLVAVAAGCLRATDLPMTGETDLSYVDVGAIAEGRVMVRLVQAVSGGTMGSWVYIAIGAAVLLGGLFLLNQIYPDALGGLLGSREG